MLPGEKLTGLCAWYSRPLHLWWRIVLIAPLSVVLLAFAMRPTAEDPAANLIESRKVLTTMCPKPEPDAARSQAAKPQSIAQFKTLL